MRFRDIFLVAAIPSATALHQSVVAHSAGVVELTPSVSGMVLPVVPQSLEDNSAAKKVADEKTDNSNSTETITNAPLPPLKTAVSDKHAVGASVMGLIVFSAAGLVLL
ncbi:hypothetical protein CIB48_g9592 [Xylaria polymorpha]|nr:hypothetical protein CIB48_g9592 [Xylaria polymorpha]